MGDNDGGGGDGLRGWSPGDYCCVGGHYLLVSRLGKGSFGEIFEGVDTASDLRVAVKVEHLKKRNPHLLHESKLYKLLQGVTGVPRIYWYGTEYQYSILIMDLLGPSTEDLFERAGRQFSRKTSLMIMYQYLARMEGIHKAGVIHRDIKPHNFVIGRKRFYDPNDEETTLVYVIDFGLSKRYCDNRRVHLPYKEGRNLTGTARYVSINTHYGVEPSRRDDLESCFYVMLYFLRGSLPWQGLRANTKKEKYLRIMERKVASTPASLCASMPVALTEMLSRIRAMRYAEDPDYHYLKSTISDLITQWGSQLDFHYDWHTPPPADPQADALWANPKFHMVKDDNTTTNHVVEDIMEEEGVYTKRIMNKSVKQLSFHHDGGRGDVIPIAAIEDDHINNTPSSIGGVTPTPGNNNSTTPGPGHTGNPGQNGPGHTTPTTPTSPNTIIPHATTTTGIATTTHHYTNRMNYGQRVNSNNTDAKFPLAPREFLTRRSNGTFEVPIRGSVFPRDSNNNRGNNSFIKQSTTGIKSAGTPTAAATTTATTTTTPTQQTTSSPVLISPNENTPNKRLLNRNHSSALTPVAGNSSAGIPSTNLPAGNPTTNTSAGNPTTNTSAGNPSVNRTSPDSKIQPNTSRSLVIEERSRQDNNNGSWARENTPTQTTRGNRGLVRLTSTLSGKTSLLFMRKKQQVNTTQQQPPPSSSTATAEQNQLIQQSGSNIMSPSSNNFADSKKPIGKSANNKTGGAWSAAVVSYFGIRKKKQQQQQPSNNGSTKRSLLAL